MIRWRTTKTFELARQALAETKGVRRLKELRRDLGLDGCFPLPYKEDMPSLGNTDIDDITEGDVAIFSIKNYWHVAYVEKVHRDQRGEATAIDVSEMNYGDSPTFPEYRAMSQSKSKDEWNMAVCCGITLELRPDNPAWRDCGGHC